MFPSHQSSSGRRLPASQHPASLLSRPLAPSARPAQRGRAAPPGAQPGPQPAAREPAGQPQHPDERAGRGGDERRRAEPRLAGLAVHGVPRRRAAQHRLLLLLVQPLRHGGRRHAARLPVSQSSRVFMFITVQVQAVGFAEVETTIKNNNTSDVK